MPDPLHQLWATLKERALADIEKNQDKRARFDIRALAREFSLNDAELDLLKRTAGDDDDLRFDDYRGSLVFYRR